MKTILFSSYHSPEVLGYPDSYTVLSDDNPENMIGHGPCSCCPNPYHMDNNQIKYWQVLYGWVAPGEYDGEVIDGHPRFGKCIEINGGGRVATRNQNLNHGGERYATEVFIHHGFPPPDDWRGSAGCLTISPSEFEKFIALFSAGEKVKIRIIDCIGMRQA